MVSGYRANSAATVSCFQRIPQHRKRRHLTFGLFVHSFFSMAIVKIHTDDLRAIHTLLGDLLGGSTTMKVDLRNRTSESHGLLSAILGLAPISSTPEPSEEAPEPVLEGDEVE